MARRLAILFRVAVTSTPSSSSTEATKGEKCQRCWRQASRYILFFPLSASWKHFSGDLRTYDRASVFTTRMSWTLSVPYCQRSRIIRSLFCSVTSGAAVVASDGVVSLDPAGLGFVLLMAQSEYIKGLLRTWAGVKALPARSATPSRSSLWRAVTRPPFLQSRAWLMVNLASHPSQCDGRSGGSSPYRRKRASRHSWSPRSVPVTVDGSTMSQAPVFAARRILCACWTGGPSSAAVNAASARCFPLCRTASRPSPRQAVWSAVRNAAWPLRAATRCPVITQDAVQFSGAVWTGSGMASPACFTGRQVFALVGSPSYSFQTTINIFAVAVPMFENMGRVNYGITTLQYP